MKRTGLFGIVTACALAFQCMLTNTAWLLCQDITLTEWKNNDLTGGDRLDVFELCLMKRLILQNR